MGGPIPLPDAVLDLLAGFPSSFTLVYPIKIYSDFQRWSVGFYSRFDTPVLSNRSEYLTVRYLEA